jgi:hypothetical protein
MNKLSEYTVARTSLLRCVRETDRLDCGTHNGVDRYGRGLSPRYVRRRCSARLDPAAGNPLSSGMDRHLGGLDCALSFALMTGAARGKPQTVGAQVMMGLTGIAPLFVSGPMIISYGTSVER